MPLFIKVCNLSTQTFDMLGKLVNLVTVRLESGGEWPDVGLATALQKMEKFVASYRGYM